MKLDVIKAFDRLEWGFLLAVLEHSGMSGMLSNFVEAGFANASSKVMLNGRQMDSIYQSFNHRI